MKISNHETSLLYAIPGAVGKRGGVRENRTGQTISQVQDEHVTWPEFWAVGPSFLVFFFYFAFLIIWPPRPL